MSVPQWLGARNLRREHFLYLASIVICVGLGPTPDTVSEGFGRIVEGPARVPIVVAVLMTVPLVSAYIPLAISLLVATTSIRLSNRVAVICAGFVFAMGALLTLVSAGLSGPGFPIALLHGVTLTFAVSASVLFLGRSQWSSDARAFGIGGLALAIAMALWSFSVVATVVYQADRIADGRSFCVAHHGENAEILSFYEMRGFSFYTTKSGYKSTSWWYLHGLLIVEADGVFNWSPRRMRFDRIEKYWSLTVPVRGSCKPRKNFFATLDII